jgi:hypothetical protein
VSVSVRCGSVQYRASCTCNSRDQEIHEIEQWLRLGFMGVFFFDNVQVHRWAGHILGIRIHSGIKLPVLKLIILILNDGVKTGP